MIVLDTHVLLWWLAADAKLSRLAQGTIDSELSSGEIIVSTITSWEIAMLIARKRLELTLNISAWIATVASIRGLRFVPVDNAIAIGATQLPGDFHKDPADRIIVATARIHAAPLITIDSKIRTYPHITAIW